MQWRNYGRAGGAVAPPLFKGQHSNSSASLQYSLPEPTLSFESARISLQASYSMAATNDCVRTASKMYSEMTKYDVIS